MPFDPTQNVVWGDDAKTPETWARAAFCEWLAEKLNGANGPYAAALGVKATRPAFVLENGEIARAMYRSDESPPVVSVMQGPVDGRAWRKKIGQITYEGTRIEIELTLDMGVRDAAPEVDDVAMEGADDSNLAGFVTDAVRGGYDELGALGLFDVAIEADAEMRRAGQGRHPQRVTFFLRVLRDFAPQ